LVAPLVGKGMCCVMRGTPECRSVISRYINDNTIQKYINQIHTSLQLNPTYENNGQINFLDLLIIRNTSKPEIDIYRKPTTMNTTINYASNHPTEHKTAAY